MGGLGERGSSVAHIVCADRARTRESAVDGSWSVRRAGKALSEVVFRGEGAGGLFEMVFDFAQQVLQTGGEGV